MNTKKLIVLTVLFTLVLLFGWANHVAGVSRETPIPPTPEAPKPALTHAQMVWTYALEWCESRGVPGAINPKDLDNTPSYGAYQFKPSTLASYARIYGVVASSSVMDYQSQRDVLEAMVLHRGEINWSQQFPDCVKKLGKPPAGATL